ncbi:MAG: hypothetical protein JSS79_15495 [Bacteroidetes bacterium]|nr:hypothetical protein [Bacteroidota bacterium]
MKIFILTLTISLSLLNTTWAQQKDSVVYKYARILYNRHKIKLFYENGGSEDLKTVLKLPSTPYQTLSDSVTSVIFFKVNNYMRSKGYELISTTGMYDPSEHFYRKRMIYK